MIIYSRFNPYRKSKFSLNTLICNENNNQFVIKKAESSDAELFLSSFIDKYNYLKTQKELKFQIVKPDKVDKAVKFEYINGQSLLEELRGIYLKHGTVSLAQAVTEYINTLINFKTTKGYLSNEFQTIFGTNSEKWDLMSIGIIDITFENFIKKDNKIFLYDYEWCWDFQVPKKYVIWRTITNLLTNFRDYNIDTQYFDEYDLMDKDFIRFENNFRNQVSSYETEYALFYDQIYAIVRPKEKVDIISINYNSKKYLDDYLGAIKNIDYPKNKYHVIIIDNASPDHSDQYIEKKICNVKNISLIRNPYNSGFVANNIGMRVSNSEFLLLLNIDTEIYPDTLTKLFERMHSDPQIGICEAKQVPHEHPKFYDKDTGETSWCSGACMLIRKSALQDTGLFDESFFMYCEDVDLSWRMWANGWKCIYEPNARCIHHNFDSKDTKKDTTFEFKYGLRNGLFMRFIYGSLFRYLVYTMQIWGIVLISKHHTFKQKKSAIVAYVSHLPHIHHLIKRKLEFRKYKFNSSPWIKFYGWDYSQ